MKNLSNNFLISMPHVSDPIFKQSLIYICNHDKNGAMGLIINKPISNLQLNQEEESILKETKLSKMNPTPNIYFGGPVDLNMGIILHPLDYITNKTIRISNQVGVTSDSKIIFNCGASVKLTVDTEDNSVLKDIIWITTSINTDNFSQYYLGLSIGLYHPI